MKRRPKLSLSHPTTEDEEQPDDEPGLHSHRSSSPGPSVNAGSNPGAKKLQSLTADEFFYFFLRMRKGEVKRIVTTLKSRYPGEDPEQLSQRLINSKTTLALLGGTLVSLPWLVPGVGQSLKLAGVVGASSMLTRMNLYLINEIALVFGEDIDDAARVGDMMAVVAATAVATATPGLLGQSLGFNPWLQLPAGALSSASNTRLIGWAAIRYFRHRAENRAFSDNVELPTTP